MSFFSLPLMGTIMTATIKRFRIKSSVSPSAAVPGIVSRQPLQSPQFFTPDRDVREGAAASTSDVPPPRFLPPLDDRSGGGCDGGISSPQSSRDDIGDPDAIQVTSTAGAAAEQWLKAWSDYHAPGENRRLLPDCANGVHIVEAAEHRYTYMSTSQTFQSKTLNLAPSISHQTCKILRPTSLHTR